MGYALHTLLHFGYLLTFKTSHIITLDFSSLLKNHFECSFVKALLHYATCFATYLAMNLF